MKTYVMLLLLFVGVPFLAWAGAGDRVGIVGGEGVDEVSLGDSPASVRAVWGEPEDTDESYGFVNWFYFTKGIAVGFRSNVVLNIMVSSRYDLPTDKGIKTGDPRSLLLQIYGPPDDITSSVSGPSFRYSANEGLDFALDEEDKVEFITVYEKGTFPIAVELATWGGVKRAFQ